MLILLAAGFVVFKYRARILVLRGRNVTVFTNPVYDVTLRTFNESEAQPSTSGTSSDRRETFSYQKLQEEDD